MQIPETVLLLAGVALAHAAWSVSDLPKGELLVPLAFVEEAGKRTLVRFEADTQEEAIRRGQESAIEWTRDAKSWAFARDGLVNDYGRKVDALTVEFWAPGMDQPVLVLQRYRPHASEGGFKLLGDPSVIIGGSIQDSAAVKKVLIGVNAGIAQHPKVASLWKTWR